MRLGRDVPSFLKGLVRVLVGAITGWNMGANDELSEVLRVVRVKLSEMNLEVSRRRLRSGFAALIAFSFVGGVVCGVSYVI